MTTTATPTAGLSARVAADLLAEAEATRLRLSWLLRDTRTALSSAEADPALLAQLSESTDYAMASMAAIVLTIKEGTQR